VPKKKKAEKSFIRWVCGKCGEVYESPIPILGKSHLCPAEGQPAKNLWMEPEEEES
jgi:hypothetical protein